MKRNRTWIKQSLQQELGGTKTSDRRLDGLWKGVPQRKKKWTTWLLKCKVRPWALKRVKRKPSLSVNANRQVEIQTSSESAAGHRQPRSCLSFVTFPSTISLAPARERSLLGRVYVISMVWLTQVNLISSTTILIAWTKFLLPYDITEWKETYTVPSKTPTSQSL